MVDDSDYKEAMFYIKELDERLQALISSVMNLEIKVAQNRGYTTELRGKIEGFGENLWQMKEKNEWSKMPEIIEEIMKNEK